MWKKVSFEYLHVLLPTGRDPLHANNAKKDHVEDDNDCCCFCSCSMYNMPLFLIGKALNFLGLSDDNDSMTF